MSESASGEADSSTDATDKDFSRPVYKCETWLHHQYWVENHSTVEMAEMADVCQQTISNWMEKYGIDNRGQHKRSEVPQENSTKKVSDEEWLREEYVNNERSTEEIAIEVGVSPEAVLYWMDKFEIDRRDHTFYSGERHWGWKGGAQDYYGPNWREARRQTLERDENKCRRCGTTAQEHKERHGRELDVHHIVPIKEYESFEKANDLDNLISLCRPCHTKLEGLPIDTT